MDPQQQGAFQLRPPPPYRGKLVAIVPATFENQITRPRIQRPIRAPHELPHGPLESRRVIGASCGGERCVALTHAVPTTEQATLTVEANRSISKRHDLTVICPAATGIAPEARVSPRSRKVV